ncbi:MAG: hypothetical protein GW911_00185 [Armatimonadetes bacterium]|nr:hypothetical protein [Armatimonadota bacterium]
MRESRSLATVSALVLMLALSALANAQGGGGRGGRVEGKVTAVDRDAKTITLKVKDGEKTLTYTEKTTVVKLEAVKLSSLTDGQNVQIMGKPADDRSSVEARIIVVLPQAPKGQRGIAGTLAKEGHNLSVKLADGKTVTVVTSAETTAAKQVEATLEEVKEGALLMAFGPETDGKVEARRITIRPAPAKAAGKANRQAGEE